MLHFYFAASLLLCDAISPDADNGAFKTYGLRGTTSSQESRGWNPNLALAVENGEDPNGADSLIQGQAGGETESEEALQNEVLKQEKDLASEVESNESAEDKAEKEADAEDELMDRTIMRHDKNEENREATEEQAEAGADGQEEEDFDDDASQRSNALPGSDGYMAHGFRRQKGVALQAQEEGDEDRFLRHD